MPEEGVWQNISIAETFLNLLEEIKDDLKPPARRIQEMPAASLFGLLALCKKSKALINFYFNSHKASCHNLSILIKYFKYCSVKPRKTVKGRSCLRLT